MHTCIHTYIYIYMHTYIHTSKQAYMLTYNRHNIANHENSRMNRLCCLKKQTSTPPLPPKQARWILHPHSHTYPYLHPYLPHLRQHVSITSNQTNSGFLLCLIGWNLSTLLSMEEYITSSMMFVENTR